MATRVTKNRLVEDIQTLKRVTTTDAPAVESEAARLQTSDAFRANAIAAGDTATAMTVAGTDGAAPTTLPMIRAGFVDSMAIQLSAAITAGGTSSLTFQLTQNGTAVGDVVSVPSGGGSAVCEVVDQSTPFAFNEGDKIGVQFTSNASLAPTTINAVVCLALRWSA